jgi:hypothetical protein
MLRAKAIGGISSEVRTVKAVAGGFVRSSPKNSACTLFWNGRIGGLSSTGPSSRSYGFLL